MTAWLLLGKARMGIPAVDTKFSSFQNSSSGNTIPVQLLPWLLSAVFGDQDIKERGSVPVGVQNISR